MLRSEGLIIEQFVPPRPGLFVCEFLLIEAFGLALGCGLGWLHGLQAGDLRKDLVIRHIADRLGHCGLPARSPAKVREQAGGGLLDSLTEPRASRLEAQGFEIGRALALLLLGRLG